LRDRVDLFIITDQKTGYGFDAALERIPASLRRNEKYLDILQDECLKQTDNDNQSSRSASPAVSYLETVSLDVGKLTAAEHLPFI
jgi:hypothetical protein